jgi:hypothetical protein
MGSMRWRVLALLLLLCAVAAFYFAFVREAPVRGKPARGPIRSLEPRATALEPIGGGPGSIAIPGEDGAESAPAAESAAAAGSLTPIDVTVVVLGRRTREPRPEQPVVLEWWPRPKSASAAEGVTDAGGEARLQLAVLPGGARDQCAVTVGSGDTAQRFQALPFRNRLIVLLEECTRLHGTVVVRGGDPGKEISVQLNEFARSAMSSEVMIGRAQTTGNGAFEIRACLPRKSNWVEVLIATDELSAARQVLWDELASDAGARIEIGFADLVVSVVDENAAPVEGAGVRVHGTGDQQPFPRVGATDGRGEFRIRLEPGEVEAIAGLEGFSSAVDRVVLTEGGEPVRLTLRLRRLGPADRLRGRVVDGDGAPIELALVTATPVMSSREAAVAGVVQGKSSADGRFELAIAGGRELDLTAYHRDLGMSDSLRFFADGREVELVIRAQGSLQVRLTPPRDLEAFGGGRVEYVLVDRRFSRVEHGHDFHLPFLVEEVPAGDYLVFVSVEGWGAYAEGSARIEAGKRTVLRAGSHTARFARGVVAGAPPGARIELEHPVWPREVEALWGAPLDDSGRFELLLGDAAQCGAQITLKSGGSTRVDLRAGDRNAVTLPR